jgi:hypothetical protein
MWFIWNHSILQREGRRSKYLSRWGCHKCTYRVLDGPLPRVKQMDQPCCITEDPISNLDAKESFIKHVIKETPCWGRTPRLLSLPRSLYKFIIPKPAGSTHRICSSSCCFPVGLECLQCNTDNSLCIMTERPLTKSRTTWGCFVSREAGLNFSIKQMSGLNPWFIAGICIGCMDCFCSQASLTSSVLYLHLCLPLCVRSRWRSKPVLLELQHTVVAFRVHTKFMKLPIHIWITANLCSLL